MATWPATLPAPMLGSFQESPPNNLIRTNMQKGPDKVRRITTANARNISFGMMLTAALVQVLDDFYVTTTYSGADTFDYTHPRTGVACTARFISPPTYAEKEGVVYAASVNLEIMP